MELGVYRHAEDRVLGAYHGPLCDLAALGGRAAKVERKLKVARVIEIVNEGGVALVSVSLKAFGYDANHLILAHGNGPDAIIINDCAGVLGVTGSNISISNEWLQRIGNRKGISIMPTV